MTTDRATPVATQASDVPPPLPPHEREFWEGIRRAKLDEVATIEKRLGIRKSERHSDLGRRRRAS